MRLHVLRFRMLEAAFSAISFCTNSMHSYISCRKVTKPPINARPRGNPRVEHRL
ncbi:hypothetical protein BDQ94DRAFT_154101 [Aspergillus welwitschiae]|uniref:Uncharacterized protein n=1 Tax=Aspergillus welwitschiae TaxID=1341132 RepID=A0A3F3PLT8_9EURO|nr:hypothetical protein BDQ94DRAFT_154101 [Aspergillus welwitschiae]RDH27316.1 hypothetical protein BDQ94DRAFT_154101 [Aspergillus welwitschiae]